MMLEIMSHSDRSPIKETDDFLIEQSKLGLEKWVTLNIDVKEKVVRLGKPQLSSISAWI